MSGRPRNPTVWCSGTPNYPAGTDPWSATTTVVLPVYNFFTPEGPVAAQSMNAILQDQSTANASALDWIGQSPVQYWPSKYDHAWTGYNSFAFWYSKLGAWVLANTNGSNVPNLFVSLNNGLSWSGGILGYTGTVGANNEITGIVELPNGNLAVAEYSSGLGTARMAQFVFATSTWSYTGHTFNWRPQHGLMFGGLPFFFSPSAGLGGNVIFYRGDANGTNFAPVMTYATGTDVIQDVRAAASPAQIVAISADTTGGTPQLWTSSDGTTWVNQASPFNASRFIAALAYGADDNIFMIAEGPIVGSHAPEHQGVTKIWTSPNGVAWTQVASLAAEGVEDLRAVGSMWVATVKNLNAVYSLDRGATWHYAFDLALTSDATAPAYEVYLRPHLAWGGGQLLAYNGVSSRGSLPAGPGASMVALT